MVRIRLSRFGVKKRPFYKIIVADKRRSRDGKFIEKLGYFNPTPSGKSMQLNLKLDRIKYWISVGAVVSDRVLNLIKKFR